MTHKFAYLFPGQGSQHVGMLSLLAENYAIITDQFNKVSERLGYDVWALVQHGPEARLNQTEFTQVVMLTADVAIFKLIQSFRNMRAAFLAGHSLGEYAALVCADVLSLEDAAWLVSHRGRIMQKHVAPGLGGMAAIIGLNTEQVIQLCNRASDDKQFVGPANFNAPEQIVIAGHTLAVEKAMALAEQAGARMAKWIPVSVPCHCLLLKSAAEEFDAYLSQVKFNAPQCSVISNVDLTLYHDADDIRLHLHQQLFSPVRWVETIQLMIEQGVDYMIESGPGKVLSGLCKRINKEIRCMAVNDETSLQQVLNLHMQEVF